MIRPLFLSVGLLLAGCDVISQQNAAPTLFVLKAEGGGVVSPALPGLRPAAIAVAPTILPEFLDRGELVQRDGANQLRPIDGQRWAERLGVGITRVVSENLQTFLPRELVTATPGRGRQQFDLEVGVDVARFALNENGVTEIAGRWTVLDPDSGKVLATQRFDLKRPAAAAYDGQISAMNGNLAQLSETVARAIAQLPPPSSPR
jgi:uncharacterized lipoprotein YmbA